MNVKNYYKTIAPRPTLCVSTVDENGSSNLAPYSFATPLTFDPPLLAIVVGSEKDTLLNAREVGDFVVAPLTRGWKNEGIRSEASLPRGESEFELVNLTESQSVEVESPSVKEAPINLECTYREELKIAKSFLLVGEVVKITGKKGAFKSSRINLEDLGPVGHVCDEEFCIANEVIKIKRD